MSNIELQFNSRDVKPENLEQVCAAVSLILRLTNVGPNHYPWSRHSVAVSDELAVHGGAAAIVEGEPEEVVTHTTPTAKPKRKRRTKAQIAADKVAAEAVIEETPVVSDTELEVDPLSDVPDQPTEATEDEVKAAVVEAVNRLTAAGSESPTRDVVAKLVELTGKKRVGEIEQGLYRTVIGGLSEI